MRAAAAAAEEARVAADAAEEASAADAAADAVDVDVASRLRRSRERMQSVRGAAGAKAQSSAGKTEFFPPKSSLVVFRRLFRLLLLPLPVFGAMLMRSSVVM